MPSNPCIKFSISLPIEAHKYIKEKSEAQFNRPISQLIAEAIDAMQKSERRLARSKKAKARK
jgi:hypothetical protein